MKKLILAIALLASSSFAIITNLNSGTTYTTMQGAATNASSGDTLLVSTGQYAHMQVINKNLMIIGGYTPDFSAQVSYHDTILDGYSYCANFSFSTSVVEGLTFTDAKYGVQIYNTSVVTARHCYVEDNVNSSDGGGIRVSGHSRLVLDHSYVDNNSTTNAGDNGGGISLSQSTLVVSEYSSIRNNYAQGSGGGIYASLSYIEVKSSSFIDNNFADESGGGVYLYNSELYLHDNGDIGYIIGDPNSTPGDGGGIYAKDSSVTFSGGGSNLRNTYAGHNGGGAYLTNSSLVFTGYAGIGYAGNSKTNYAVNSGGGIYALHSTVALTNAEVFGCYVVNDGGAIYAEESDVSLYRCEFGNTNADYSNHSESDGGAVNVQNGNLFISRSTFHDNYSVDDGAAVFIDDSHLVVTNSVFVNNQATDNGGGIYVDSGVAYAEIYDSSIITNSGDDGAGIWWNSNSNLTVRGSSINANETYKDDGGGAYLTGSGLVVFDDVEMLGNTAIDDGGAILVKQDQNLKLIDCDIRLNKADSNADSNGDGGAIGASDRAKVEILTETKNVNIGANRAALGGAILVAGQYSVVDIVSTSGYSLYMSGNHANTGGGGIFAFGEGAANILGKVIIQQSDSPFGGGICAVAEASVNINQIGNAQPEIRNCTASGSGGALYIESSNTFVVCNGVKFGKENFRNKSKGIGDGFGGGAVAVFDSGNFIATNCSFKQNISLSHGGAIYVSNATALIYGDVSGGVAGPLPPSIFMNNFATNGLGTGGAVYVTDEGNAEFYNTAMISNSAWRGGGVYADKDSLTKFVNSVIAQNHVDVPLNSGGGVRLWDATAIMNYCTIANNYRSGVEVEGATAFLYMKNCIVWGHQYAEVTTNELLSSVEYSDIEGGSPGIGNIDSAPLFADFHNLDYEITANSPCTNTAENIGITEDCIGTIRPQLGGYDMGAYEFVPEPGTVFSILYSVIGIFILFRKIK